MLRKRRLDDGGMETVTCLLGPAVFLDVLAVREFSRAPLWELRGRFASVLKGRSGSLLVSSAWVTEMDTLQGDSRTRAQAFLTSLGANWLLISPVVSSVVAREARDELGAYLSDASLDAYVRNRCGELLREGADPHALTDDEFFDLGRTLVWTAVDDPKAVTTSAAQAQALKDAATARANADRDDQRRDATACDRLYPAVIFSSGGMHCAHNAIWREVTRRSLGRTWMPNDGFDVAHLVPALTIGGFIAVDSAWQAIGQAAACDLPLGYATFYRPGQLEELVADLER